MARQKGESFLDVELLVLTRCFMIQGMQLQETASKQSLGAALEPNEFRKRHSGHRDIAGDHFPGHDHLKQWVFQSRTRPRGPKLVETKASSTHLGLGPHLVGAGPPSNLQPQLPTQNVCLGSRGCFSVPSSGLFFLPATFKRPKLAGCFFPRGTRHAASADGHERTARSPAGGARAQWALWVPGMHFMRST